MSDGHDERALQPGEIVTVTPATPAQRAPRPVDWAAHRRRYPGRGWRAGNRFNPNDWAVAVVDAHA